MSVENSNRCEISALLARHYKRITRVWMRCAGRYSNLPQDEIRGELTTFLMRLWTAPESTSGQTVAAILLTLDSGEGQGKFASVGAAEGAIYQSACNACNTLYRKYNTHGADLSNPSAVDADEDGCGDVSRAETNSSETAVDRPAYHSRFADGDVEEQAAPREDWFTLNEQQLEAGSQRIYYRILALKKGERQVVVSACLLNSGFKLHEVAPLFDRDLGTLSRWAKKGRAWLAGQLREDADCYLDEDRQYATQREILRRLFARIVQLEGLELESVEE